MVACRSLKCTALALLSLLVIVALLSWIVAFVVTLFRSRTLHPIRAGSFSGNKLQSQPPFPSNTPDNIFWFLQISDIHISKFKDPKRAFDLAELCKSRIAIIKPSLVLITGDLTDAKTADGRGSLQYVEEWQLYKNTVDKCKTRTDTFWLDMRGNHDAFKMEGRHDERNLYKMHGISGRLFKDGVTLQHKMAFNFGTYLFNGIDLAPNPGPGRPFNFFAAINKKELTSIQKLAKTPKNNMTIWFGHYPLSLTTTPVELRNIISQGAAYLCGHLHTLGNFVPVMHARQPQGYLELELGDWKENRRYRVLAVDHDVLSFTDVSLNQWPIVLITNPKSAAYVTDNGEKFDRMTKSTHIRFLVFDDANTVDSDVSIDDVSLCSPATNIRGPLYSCQWDPYLYNTGFHQLRVEVKDDRGRTAVSEITFSLDNSGEELPWLGAVILLTDFVTVLQVMYYSLFFVLVLAPITIHVCNHANVIRVLRDVPLFGNAAAFVCRRELFYPLASYSVFLAMGPVFIGELVPGSIGVCFTYGIYTNGHWIPGSLTYLYSAIHLLFYNFPIMVCLGSMGKQPRSLCRRFVQILTLVLVFLLKISLSYTNFIAYGFLACMTSLADFWVLPFTFYLFYKAIRCTINSR